MLPLPALTPNFNASMRALVTLIVFVFSSVIAFGQTIVGVVNDAGGGRALGDVIVYNIHQDAGITTDGSGRFSVNAAPGQLIEFRKVGYKTARLRMSTVPAPFYNIIMEPGVQELEEIEVHGRFRDYKHDSLRFREYFKKQLDYNVVTGWRAFQSPFSAMSKTNRQMISFQQEYAWFEQQKYVDYTFNEKIIANLTGLRGDSAVQYMRRFRPSYEMLRAMPEYDYFSYVKRTVEMWRERQRLGPGRSRGGSSGG